MEAAKGNGSKTTMGPRYYTRESVMNVEEDRTHEFKGHKNIAIEEIPPWCIDAQDKTRKTRNCISRNICGFLNSGLGGIIYVGVLDNGSIVGILLSQYQRDHLRLSLKDTLQRFRPPVPSHLVSLEFVPCIDKSDVKYRQVAKRFNHDGNLSEESLTENCSKNTDTAVDSGVTNDTNSGGWDWAVEKVDETELPKYLKFKNDQLRMRPHILQTHRQCWCDDDAVTRASHGHRSPLYVVEIVVRPPSAKDPEIRKHLPPSSELQIQPIFQAEDGSIYVRRHASLARRSLQDMVNEVIEDTNRAYFPILKEAEIHLHVLEALVEKVESMKVEDGNIIETAADVERVEKNVESLLQKIKHI